MMFTLADGIIAIVILLSAGISWMRGFVKEVLSLIAWIGAFIVGFLFSHHLAEFFTNYIKMPSLRVVLAFGILFLLTFILISLINFALSFLIQRINHRDFYLCHFLLERNKSSPDLYIIDLHRAQIRRKTPLRWKIKDLSGLYFSTMNFNFTQRDYLRFIRLYTNTPLRVTLKKNRLFWKIVSIKAKRLYQKHH